MRLRCANQRAHNVHSVMLSKAVAEEQFSIARRSSHFASLSFLLAAFVEFHSQILLFILPAARFSMPEAIRTIVSPIFTGRQPLISAFCTIWNEGDMGITKGFSEFNYLFGRRRFQLMVRCV